MVLHRRLDYGFIGYEVPPVPRAARSIRKKSPRRSTVGDEQMCAFDLLATLAGNILLEGQSSITASTAETIIGTVKQEIIDDDHDKLLNAEKLNQGSSEISPVVDEHNLLLSQSDKELSNPLGASSSRPSTGLTKKTNPNGNKVLDDNSSVSVSLLRKLEGFSSGEINSCVPKLEGQVMEHIQSEAPFIVGSPNCRQSEDPKLFDHEPPAFVSSGSSMKLYSHRDHYSCGSLFPSMENVNVVSRDDDEKRLMSTKRSRGMKTRRTRALTIDQRIRKLLVSKYWRKPSKVKYHDLYDSARDLHTVSQYRKIGFKRLNSQRIYPMKKKKRRFFYRSPSSQDGVTGYKSVYISSEKEANTSTAFGALGHEATGRLSVMAGQSSLFQSRESHVKVRIKSFRVPELFIELPETATVGSLKRTVLEAVTTLLGGELHVGVVLKGRKIRDDNKTLVQTGISQDNKVDGLGFTLEPDHPLVYSSIGSEDLPAIQMSNPVLRPAPAADIAHQSTHASADNPAKDMAYLIKTDHDSVLVPSEISMENENVDLKAPVTLTEANAETLAAMPHKKSKRYELGQRRIRRPFSVSEVDLLVGAVEKIGTGRWRDVKLLAFDNVEHRTYVDLKDKWKTLVHTASISPQQRRGEPVPQELLDRVLAAHGYWSEPQSKQQLEQQPESRLHLEK